MMPLMIIWKAKSPETDQQTIENWYKKDNTNGIYPLQFLMIFEIKHRPSANERWSVFFT